MDQLQDFINTIVGVVLTGLIAFGRWVVVKINEKPSKEEVRELISDKQMIYAIYVQELKEDIRRLEEKLDKLLER